MKPLRLLKLGNYTVILSVQAEIRTVENQCAQKTLNLLQTVDSVGGFMSCGMKSCNKAFTE